MVWVAFAWVSRLLQREFSLIATAVRLTSYILETDSHAFAHLIFALSFGLCAYNFFRAMTLDPGTCPTPKSDAELKSVSDSALRVVLIQCFVFL
jgi:hypothetical protein